MSSFSVRESGQLLGVSDVQVGRLISQGDISARRFGRSWMIDSASVHRYLDLRPSVGRPFSPARAWAVLAAASIDLDAGRRLAGLCRRRAVRHAVRVTPGALNAAIADAAIAASGVLRAQELQAAVDARPPFAGYVRAGDFADFVARHHVAIHSEEPNLFLREVDDALWPFDRDGVPAIVALVDLIDDGDARSAAELVAAMR
jgi:excisionase family DNA binding protein